MIENRFCQLKWLDVLPKCDNTICQGCCYYVDYQTMIEKFNLVLRNKELPEKYLAKVESIMDSFKFIASNS